MSSTASNYDIFMLGLGTGLAMVSTILTLSPGLETFARSRLRVRSRCSCIWITFISVSYGLTMFASSYVEEEHHYWNWMSSGWLAWLFLTR